MVPPLSPAPPSRRYGRTRNPRLSVLLVQRTKRFGFDPSSGLVRLVVPLQACAENGIALDRGPAQTVETPAPAHGTDSPRDRPDFCTDGRCLSVDCQTAVRHRHAIDGMCPVAGLGY